MNTSSFSLHRLCLLLRSDFLSEWRMHIAVSAVVAILVFLTCIHPPFDAWEQSERYAKLFGHTLFIWGIWATSLTFRPLHDRTRREMYLLLPTSPLEKLIARLLPLTVGLGIMLPLYFLVLSALIESFNQLSYGHRRPWFNPFGLDLWSLYGPYILVQSAFFLGAVWFRRFAFLKTALTLILLQMGFVGLIFTAVYFTVGSIHGHLMDIWNLHGPVSSDHINPLERWFYGVMRNPTADFIRSSRDTLSTIIQAGAVLLPFVLWWIAWLRLKEAQVNDGI